MILIKTTKQLQLLLKKHREEKKEIGFVPTMGALHSGHLTLIKESKNNYDITVCSIFINPTQFNNQQDFEKYPVTIENDIDLLSGAACDILFLPSVLEMYPVNDPVEQYELGYLETLLEGKFRPRHFQGVCRIVDKLLNVVQPTALLLGQKDFQQCMVIAEMIRLRKHTVKLKIVETIREPDGLAMSSRNLRLSPTEREQALHIINALQSIKLHFKPGPTLSLINDARVNLENNGFKVDYVSIADSNNLKEIEIWDGNTAAVALVAAFLNEVRLIDNLILYPDKIAK